MEVEAWRLKRLPAKSSKSIEASWLAAALAASIAASAAAIAARAASAASLAWSAAALRLSSD